MHLKIFHTDTEKAVLQFRLAFSEDKILATANLLYFLDIRKGKGERKIFKTNNFYNIRVKNQFFMK